MKNDMVQDKKMVKKAINMHDDQLHGGKKTNLTNLRGGGMATKKMATKKMAMGGMAMGKVKTAAPSRDGVAMKGKTKGTMVKMCSGGMGKKAK